MTKDDLLELCFNFISHDQESDSFRFVHLSVREFLETKEGFEGESCHRTAAIFCLRCMIEPGLAYRLFPNYPIKRPADMDETRTTSSQEEDETSDSDDFAGLPKIIISEATDEESMDPEKAYQLVGENLTSYEYACMLWPYHLSLSSSHRHCEPLKTLASNFMLGDEPELATFHEWAHLMYEDGWRLRSSYSGSLRHSYRRYDPKVKSLPTHDSRGQPIDYERMIHDSSRWTSTDSQPWSRFIATDPSPRTDPIFASCVWDLSDILQARVDFNPTSIDRDSNVPQRNLNFLERAWWTAAEPADRVRALDLACLYENFDCVKILLHAGAKATGQLALSFAIQTQRADIVQLLLEHGAPLGTPGDIEMWDQEMAWPTGFGSNPLHQTVIVGSPKILDMLLRYGVDPNTRIEGISALDLAKSMKKMDMVRRLADAGAIPDSKLTLEQDGKSGSSHDHILFGNILQHLTTEERLQLYFGLQHGEDTKSGRSRRDVKAFISGDARGPLFTYSKDHELLLVVTQHQ